MATCSLSTVLSQACANGFLQAANTSPALSQAVELQLLYLISASSLTLAQLEAQACANGFTQLAFTNPNSANAIIAQLLCNISGGT